MCAHSVSDTSPPQTDCLSLRVMGTPLENLFPPIHPLHLPPTPLAFSTHTLRHHLSLSLPPHPVTILLLYLFFLSAQIFHKLPAFLGISVPLFSLHNF